jgi:hypothetical protein
MSADKEAGSETIDWFVEPDQAVPGAGARAGTGSGSGSGGYRRARREEKRANSLGIAVTTSLLFVLTAAAILVGGHAAIAPLLRRAVATRSAEGIGDVVYTMPDGVFCRHMSLDNVTGEVTGGALERCPESIGRGRETGAAKFEWGRH